MLFEADYAKNYASIMYQCLYAMVQKSQTDDDQKLKSRGGPALNLLDLNHLKNVHQRAARRLRSDRRARSRV